MNWRDAVHDKLMTPDEAVAVVRPDHQVSVAPFTCTPFTLCQALYRRRHELRGMRLDHPAGLFPWAQPGEDPAFEVHTVYATPADRDLVNQGLAEYLPVATWQGDPLPWGLIQEPDVYLVPISPPDRNGYCSFGPGVWFSRILCQRSKLVIAEVHENFIRTGGENFVHVSRIHRMCEAVEATGTLPIPPRTDEEIRVTEVICTLVASELVRDRDTVQIGIGTVSSATALYLKDKEDLGIQTEIITGGVAELVQMGVATGKYKTLHQGKVVGSALVAMPQEEMALIDGNPVFELYGFDYVDDVRMLAQHDNLVAINNALMVDLTGQVASESLGTRVWTGVGGQTAFCIAAQYSRGGRAIIVLPSSHLVNGERRSRIVPVLPEGSLVTVPRTFVDYVVTEYGIASLRGKTVRERIRELVAVAHPDFREGLKQEARRLYAITP